MTDEKNSSEQIGANLNLVASDDAFSINAPYAKVGGAYTVLAHGPNEKGDMSLSSRAITKDSMDAKYNPHELANIIKTDPNYHEGQPVVLFACNAGKWGRESYAQALSNEMGTKVIAPTENIVGVSFGPKSDNHFKEWVIAEDIEEVKPIKIFGQEVYSPTFDKVVIDSEGKYASGKSIYLKVNNLGEFTSFNPVNEINTDKLNLPTNPKKEINHPDKQSQLDMNQKEALITQAAREIGKLPEAQRGFAYEQLAIIANNTGMLTEAEAIPGAQKSIITA